jgi:PAS domain-containing protein
MIPAGTERAAPALQQLTDELHASEMRYRRLFEAAKDGILILDARTGELDAVNPFVSNAYMAGDRKVMQCNIRDITARTRADRQLQLQGVALDAAANAIVITDPGPHRVGQPGISGVTSYTASAPSGNPRPAQLGPARSRVLPGALGHDSVRQTARRDLNRRKDGSLYTEEQAITPVRNARGAIGHFIAIKQDVTERKRAQEALGERGKPRGADVASPSRAATLRGTCCSAAPGPWSDTWTPHLRVSGRSIRKRTCWSCKQAPACTPTWMVPIAACRLASL